MQVVQRFLQKSLWRGLLAHGLRYVKDSERIFDKAFNRWEGLSKLTGKKRENGQASIPPKCDPGRPRNSERETYCWKQKY